MGPEKAELKAMQKSLTSFIPKGKEGGREPLAVIVDYRERGCELVAELQAQGINIEFKNLKVGDYVVSENTAVERKSFEDFASSIIDRRLFEQARSLKEAYTQPILLIEGRGPSRRAVTEEALTGAVISMILDFGLLLLRADDAKEAAKIIVALAKREQRGEKKAISLKDRRCPTTPDGEREYVVSSLPFVEALTAKKLLTALGSVQAVFTADEKTLMGVEGIGPKKAKRIRELAGDPYGVSPSSGEPCPQSHKERTAS